MSGKSKINIFNKMSEEDLDKAIKEYNGNYRYYQRLIALNLVSYLSVHRWAKACEESGLSGLMPNFAGGRPPKLTTIMEKKLYKKIDSKKNITMVDVQQILNDEFDIEFSLPHLCSIVRKLGFDYVQSNDETNNKKPTLVKIKQ